MLNTIRIRQSQNRVALLRDGRLLADLAPEEAVQLAGALKLATVDPAEGWIYADGRLKVGRAKERVVVLIDGKAAIDCPQSACLTIAGHLRNAGKCAEHWELLNHTKPRERLYADQELLVGAGLPYLNLGVPYNEFRTMGGFTAHRGSEVGVPTLVGKPPKTERIAR